MEITVVGNTKDEDSIDFFMKHQNKSLMSLSLEKSIEHKELDCIPHGYLIHSSEDNSKFLLNEPLEQDGDEGYHVSKVLYAKEDRVLQELMKTDDIDEATSGILHGFPPTAVEFFSGLNMESMTADSMNRLGIIYVNYAGLRFFSHGGLIGENKQELFRMYKHIGGFSYSNIHLITKSNTREQSGNRPLVHPWSHGVGCIIDDVAW
jgi:hypothetical protein